MNLLYVVVEHRRAGAASAKNCPVNGQESGHAIDTIEQVVAPMADKSLQCRAGGSERRSLWPVH